MTATPSNIPRSTAPAASIHRLRLAIAADTTDGFDFAALIPVFHRLIQRRALPWALIDVADYRHVERGPGVLLIGHEGDLALGWEVDGRLTLAYQQKRREGEGGLEAHLARAVERLLAAARALDGAEGLDGLSLDTRHWSLRLLDRLRTQDVAATRAVVEPLLRRQLALTVDGSKIELTFDDADPRRPLGLDLRLPSAVPLGLPEPTPRLDPAPAEMAVAAL